MMNPLERLELKNGEEVIVRVEKLLNASMDCLDRRIKSYLKNSCLRQRANDTPRNKLHSLTLCRNTSL